jgi:putative endonuclease
MRFLSSALLKAGKAPSDEEKAVGQYYVYIMTNRSGTLYVGVTNNLRRRVWQHKQKLIEGFTRRYNITRLIYFEETPDVAAAIAREKQIKGWLRKKKVGLIESVNPGWKDLSEGWHG